MACAEFANFTAMFAATSDTASAAPIGAENDDTATLTGLTKALILANPGEFLFGRWAELPSPYPTPFPLPHPHPPR